MLATMLEKHPELTDEAVNMIPTRNSDAQISELTATKDKILQALPENGELDASAFAKVRPPLMGFKDSFVSFAKLYQDSKEWALLFELTKAAVNLTAELPVFNEERHNATRTSIFKQTAVYFRQSVKNTKATAAVVDPVIEQLTRLNEPALEAAISDLEIYLGRKPKPQKGAGKKQEGGDDGADDSKSAMPMATEVSVTA